MNRGITRWRRRKQAGHWVGGAVLIVLGATVLALQAPDLLVKWQAAGWPQGRARIVTARRGGVGGRASVVEGPVIELSFIYATPDGRQFDARQGVSGDFARRLGIEEPTSRLGSRPVSAGAVACWYDPDRPTRAVVEREFVRKDLAMVAMALVPIALGIAVIRSGRRVAAAVLHDPVEAMRRRNRDGWKVERLPTGGARCEIKPSGGATSLAAITSRLSGHPLVAVDVLGLPLGPGQPCRLRVLLRDPAAPGVSIDLQAGEPPRGIFNAGRTVWTERVVAPSAAVPGEGLVEVKLPDAAAVTEGAEDWWLRVVAEAGAAVHPPALLILPYEAGGADDGAAVRAT